MAADHLSLGMAEVARRLAHAEAERDTLRAALEALTAEADHFKFVVLKPQLYTDRCTQHRAHRYLAAVEAAGRVLHAHGVNTPLGPPMDGDAGGGAPSQADETMRLAAEFAAAHAEWLYGPEEKQGENYAVRATAVGALRAHVRGGPVARADGVVTAIASQSLADAARVLAEFAKTAPGRLPQRVQDAIAVAAGVEGRKP